MADRTDRIYRQCRKKGNRPAGYEGSGYRRLGRIIADETDVIDIYDAALTMEGLRYIYEKNRR